jgi:hypothetical protein
VLESTKCDAWNPAARLSVALFPDDIQSGTCPATAAASSCADAKKSLLSRRILLKLPFILYTLLVLAVVSRLVLCSSGHRNTFQEDTEDRSYQPGHAIPFRQSLCPLCRNDKSSSRIEKGYRTIVNSLMLGWVPFALLRLGESGVLPDAQGHAIIRVVTPLVPTLFVSYARALVTSDTDENPSQAISYTLVLLMVDIDLGSVDRGQDVGFEEEFALLESDARSPTPESPI